MSTNPYAQASASAAAPAASPEQQQQFDYELAIGRNKDYYLPRFEQFDQGGSKAGWHWPAFFVTSWWFLYRKMFGVGLAHLLLLPIFTALLAGLLIGAIKPSPAVSALIVIVVLFVPGAVLSVFASSLYWRRVRKAIRDVPSSFTNQHDKRARRIERNGGTGVGPMLGVMLGVGLFGSSILAAIAIPAYQDYTIRAQVAEGLDLASAAKARVEEIWISEHRWAEQDDMPGDMPSGKYVEKVEVFTGSVVITFGRAANPHIRGQRMALTPAANQDGDIRWVCGNAATPRGWTPSEGYLGSDVPDKYLPVRCRSGS